LSHDALLPPNWDNHLLFGVMKEEQSSGAQATAPAILVNEAFSAGPSPSFTQDDIRAYDVQNTTTYYGRAGHVLLFGGRFRSDRMAAFDASNFGGTFEFGSLSQFAASAPLIFRVNRGDPNIGFSTHRASGFVQDEIRARPQLTLTFGLRYDWQSTTTDRNNLAPRFWVCLRSEKAKDRLTRRRGDLLR